MTKAICFWVLMILWLVLEVRVSGGWKAAAGSILPWLCVAIVGWAEFGPVIQ